MPHEHLARNMAIRRPERPGIAPGEGLLVTDEVHQRGPAPLLPADRPSPALPSQRPSGHHAVSPTVSTPLTWTELDEGTIDPARFSPQEVLERVKRLGDLFASVLQADQHIT